MKLYIISFTSRGKQLATKLSDQLSHHQVTLFQGEGQEKITLKQFSQRGFAEAEGLIFISPTGIAVRAIAPELQQRLKDPAVVVVDDEGKFVISLLSGHWGGANQLTQEVASGLGGTPVVTTAMDRYNVFAVDIYAREHGFTLVNSTRIKEISGKLLKKEKIKVFSSFPIRQLAEGLEISEDYNEAEMVFDTKPHPSALTLIPQDYVLGFGCHKESDPLILQAFAERCLEEHGISLMSIRAIASSDSKRGVAALQALSREWEVPFMTFSTEELAEISGDFTPSTFVLEQVGTDDLCERSAVALGGGNLVVKKQIYQGYTLALAKQEREISIGELRKP